MQKVKTFKGYSHGEVDEKVNVFIMAKNIVVQDVSIALVKYNELLIHQATLLYSENTLPDQ